jgi:hypothetical protein
MEVINEQRTGIVAAGVGDLGVLGQGKHLY